MSDLYLNFHNVVFLFMSLYTTQAYSIWTSFSC